MNKSVVVSLCLGLALAGACWGGGAGEEKEPLFDGKSLHDWVEMLKDKDTKTQRTAAAALAKIGKKASPATPALLDILKNGENAYARHLAAYVLGYIRPDAATAVPALLEAIKEKDKALRRAAAPSLIVLWPASKSVVPDIIQMLKAKEAQQRQLAAYILGNLPLEPKEVVPALTEARNDKSEAVRLAVEGALKNFSPPEPSTTVGKAPPGPGRTVEEAIRAIVEVQPEVLWKELPASYQKDLQALSTEFGKKMDPEVWNRGCALARKGALVLRVKKRLLLGKGRHAEEEVKFGAQYNAMIDALQAIVTGELSNLGTYKKGDVETMISGPVTKFLKSLIEIAKNVDSVPLEGVRLRILEMPAKFQKARVTAIKIERNQAVVFIDWGMGERTELVMVDVEEKWFPKTMVDAWAGNVKQARGYLATMQAYFLKDKGKMLQTLDLIDQKLDKLNAAQTKAESEAALLEILQAGLGR